MSNSLIVPSATPALVIAIGRLGSEVAAEIEPVYLRGNPHRRIVTHFLSLILDSKTSRASLVPLPFSSNADDATMNYRQVYQAVLDSMVEVKATLDTALHDLFSHQALVAIGLVLCGGMFVGTLFTLFMVPSIYMLVAKDHGKADTGAGG